MRLRYFLTILLMTLSLQSWAVESSCFKYIRVLSKSLEKTLPENAKSLGSLISGDEVQLSKLYELFDLLKAQEETYLDTYINRSKSKRSFSEKELEYVRKTFKLDNLSDEDVQTFYANEIYRLYSFVDFSIHEYKAIESVDISKFSKEELDHVRKVLILTYQSTIKSSNIRALGMDSHSLHSQIESLSFESIEVLLKSYDLVSVDQFDSAKSLLLNSGFQNSDAIIRNFQDSKMGLSNCCKEGDGCLFCPNNLGLRSKNKK
ncbi:hypothetical protein HBN50_11290 [Halobacteriovorax sp. GB3]|uniref:hypothetical protein n=1 Tax=Halobacteriovorax sp. GB3 TaxID=2719615 RepID=UPI00235F4A3C|nr:hypothetical protein [Halobacteriovorax sp. GB3]MDD0853684.1 hypothetical protein [Halobacteriovorax sp. GB3]